MILLGSWAAAGLAGALGDHLPTSAGARRWRDRTRPQQDADRASAAAEELWTTHPDSRWSRLAARAVFREAWQRELIGD